MKSSVESINKVQFRINVELSSEDTQSAFDNAYKKLRGRAQIKGFRKGKAPLHMLKKFYKESVAADVADTLIKNHLFSAIEKESITPISQPVLEKAGLPSEGEGYSFTALVDIMPEIVVDGYKGLNISYQELTVNDASVDEEIQNLRRRFAKIKEIDDKEVKAKEGHLIQLTQKAFLGDKPIDRLNADDATVELGQKQIHEKLEASVMGLKVGDNAEVEIDVPSDSGDEELSGKKIKLQVVLNTIKELVLPEINDDFAKDLETDNLDDLKKKIVKSQENQADRYKREQLEHQVLDQIAEKIAFDVPPSIVDRVIDSILKEKYAKDEAKYKASVSDPKERDEAKDLAKRKAKNSMILHEIIRKEELKLDDDDIEKIIVERELDKESAEKWKNSLTAESKENLLYIKAMDMLISEGTVTLLAPEKK